MKRFFVFAIWVGLGLSLLTACVDDGDNHAEAKVSFQGVLTQLNYTLVNDDTDSDDAMEETEESQEQVFDYKEFLTDAFNQLELTGPKSVIEESAKVADGSISYAEYVCAMQAAEKIQKKLDNITIDNIKQTVFSMHKEDMTMLGFEKPEDIPFASLSAEISYFSSTTNQPIVFNKEFL